MPLEILPPAPPATINCQQCPSPKLMLTLCKASGSIVFIFSCSVFTWFLQKAKYKCKSYRTYKRRLILFQCHSKYQVNLGLSSVSTTWRKISECNLGDVLMCCLFIYLMCACVFSRYVYLCTTIMPGALEARKRLRIPWNWCFRSCELPCGCWELDPGRLEEQTVLLPAETSPSHPNVIIYLKNKLTSVQQDCTFSLSISSSPFTWFSFS